jgi:hypothetical protein
MRVIPAISLGLGVLAFRLRQGLFEHFLRRSFFTAHDAYGMANSSWRDDEDFLATAFFFGASFCLPPRSDLSQPMSQTGQRAARSLVFRSGLL